MRQRNREHQGSFLIELMISISLSVLLCFMFMQLYLYHHRSLALQVELSQIQTNAETAIAKIRTSIHQAGYMGCPRLQRLLPIGGELGSLLTMNNKVSAKDAGPIILRYAAYEHATVLAMHAFQQIRANTAVHFKVGDVVVISDCQHADIFKIKKVFGNKRTQRILPEQPLTYSYQKGSEIARLLVEQYAIRPSKHNRWRKTLYITHLQNQGQSLVDDVVGLHVRATVKHEHSFEEMNASQVSNWAEVVGLAIELTLSSAHLTKNWAFYTAVGEIR